MDGVLTLGVLWLAHCREHAGGRRLYRGLRVIVPKGMATLTASRLAWMSGDAAQWELWEFDEKTEELEQRDAADQGNVTTRLVHAPSETAARERFAEAAARVMALVPEAMRGMVEQRVRGGAEMAFLLHGLEFARVRTGYAGAELQPGAGGFVWRGAERDPLVGRECGRVARVGGAAIRAKDAGQKTESLTGAIRCTGCSRSVGWRACCGGMWRRIDRHLDAAHVYTQVPAFAAADRGCWTCCRWIRMGGWR